MDANTRKLLEQSALIIGKVVADNLMPNIAAPQFPARLLERIQEALREGTEGEICGACKQNDAEGRLQDGTPACPYCQEDEMYRLNPEL